MFLSLTMLVIDAPFLLPKLSEETLSSIFSKEDINELSNDDRNFILLLKEVAVDSIVSKNKSESKTDTLIAFLLDKLGYWDYPLCIR